MKKQHINSLNNLLSKYSKQEIIDNIDIIENDQKDSIAYKEVFATDETAVTWFKNFCAQYNLTVTRVHRQNRHTGELVPYGRYVVEELKDNWHPYFTLWIIDGHQNDHQVPHVELGSSLEDLWSHMFRLSALENKMHEICELKGFKKYA